MSYLNDVSELYKNEHTLVSSNSDIDMPSVAGYEIPSQQTQSFIQSFQSNFISKEQLENLNPFQNMFTQSSLSNAEHDSAVFKPRSPWEDESYHLDNFIPFLTKPKKLKLSDISDDLPTNSNSNDPQAAECNYQELKECGLLDRFKGITPEDELTSNSHQTVAEDSTAMQYEGMSLLETARKFLDEKSSVNSIKNEVPPRDEETVEEGNEVLLNKQRPRLYPGYKPGKSFVDELSSREGAPNCYPEVDLASPDSYSLQHIHLLTQQIYNLIEGEADNNSRIQAIKESYKDSDLCCLHENLDFTLHHSLNVLMECQNICQRVCKLEEHASILAHILVETGIVKAESNSDSD